MYTKIKVGVVGVARGNTFITGAAQSTGMELVAVCDIRQERLEERAAHWNVAAYTDFDKFLEHDMDAVVLANYFHQHADFAIKALRAGKNVLSECAACHTLAEGVALAREFEKHNLIYMLAENYPFMAYNQEMRRIYRSGEVGKFLYGECEYIHPDPAKVKNQRSCGQNHWRNWLPWGHYYCTHSLGPLMCITNTRPVKVSSFTVPYDCDDPTLTDTAMINDTAGILMCTMDNAAVAKIIQGSLRGHGNYTRIQCSRGLMENTRHGDQQYVRLWKEPWEKDGSTPCEVVYKPDFPIYHKQAIEYGHGGGDFFTFYYFREAILSGIQPYLDVYRAIDMSITGILGWRSALNNSMSFDVPDFRDERQRKKYEDDHYTPNPQAPEEYRLPTSVLGRIQPSSEGLKKARNDWKEVGFEEEI